MTAVILTILGVPLWLIAVYLFMLIRARSKVVRVPGSVRCKVRTSAPIPGLQDEFARYASTAHWVHDVLVIHLGSFMLRPLPLGVTGTSAGPEPAEANSRIKKLDSPVTMRFTLDSGAEIELACAAADANRLLGPFAAAGSSTD